MSQLIVQATLILLTLAALVFAFQAIRQRRTGALAGSSFPTVLLVVIVGWTTTEVISDAIGTSLGVAGEWAHLTVMVLFAAAVTLQLKYARKEP